MDNDSPKLLVVVDAGLSPRLAEYALEVAVRLDLEIIVLFVDEESSWQDQDELRRRVVELESRGEHEAAAFTSLAWKSSVNVTTIVDVDKRESAVARIREQDESIRFILSDTEGEQGTGNRPQQPQLTVIRPA
jgi:hypothetical protein